MGLLDVFTGGIVKDVSEGLDSLFTSDEERLEARNTFAAINEKIISGGNDLSIKMNQAVTDRHTADMTSDSWLSKNIRPITLIVMTACTLLFVFLSAPASDAQIRAYELKLDLLAALDMMIFGFYFGSRGVEKVAASIAKAIKPKPKEPDEDW